MRSIGAALSCLVLFACSQPAKKEPGPALAVASAALPAVPDIDLGDTGLAFATPVRSENLVVWPVVLGPDAAPVEGDSFRSLDASLASGAVEVLETGEVQQLMLKNTSDEPVLLLAGEVLDGGQQDRIVAHDTVVEPGETVPLASFCVEQGRWSAESGDASGGAKFKGGGVLAVGSVRAAAQVASAQQEVWSNVACTNALNSSPTPTGTYMAVVENEEVQKQVEERARGVLAHLMQQEGAVGFVAALDLGAEDEFVVAEVFGSPKLFQVYREKLVRSYALDAITREKGELLASAGGGAGPATAGQTLHMEQSLGIGFGASFGGAGPSQSLDTAVAFDPAHSPHVTVAEDRVVAANADWKHLHRTIYKRAPR